MSRAIVTLLMLTVVAGVISAQVEPDSDASEAATEDDDIFSDPFALVEEAPTDDDQLATPDDPESPDALFDTADLDELFDTDVMIVEGPEPDPDLAVQDDLLLTAGVEWGGSFRGSVVADWAWDTVWTSDFWPFDPTDMTLRPSAGANLFFDSRPESDFRVFGELRIDTTSDGAAEISGLSLTPGNIDDSFLPVGWTSQPNEQGETEIRDQNGILIVTLPGAGSDDETAEPSTGVAPGLEVNVYELFGDYVFRDALFFRFGKHTIKWGTGYFYSPADVLNLTSIDPEDPELNREGPISFRIHYPFGITGNAFLYLIANDQIEPLDIAVAPKIEVAFGSGEFGLGAYYQRALAPRLVGLGSLSIGDVDFYGEGVVLYGSDRIFVRPSRNQTAAEVSDDDGLALVLDTYEAEDAIFAQATFGVRYLRNWENRLSLLVVGEYFFNGEGYADEENGLIPAATRLLLFPGENGLALDESEQPEDYEPPVALRLADLSSWGRHYAAATVAATNLFGTDLGVTVFALSNLTDLSGIVTPGVSYTFLEKFNVTMSGRFTFGDEDDEFTDPEALLTGGEPAPTFGLSLSVSFPGGRF